MAILGQNFEGIMDGADRAMFDSNFDRSGAMIMRTAGESTTAADRWCIAVIDEVSQSYSAMASQYAAFRAAWPDRKLFLLVPQAILNGPTTTTSPAGQEYVTPGIGTVWVPAQANADRATGLFTGPTRVNRDNGVIGSLSDWFTITGLDSLASGAKVGLFVDNSGSMYTSTVQASYNKFLADVAAAGLSIITVTDGSEDWIQPFITMSGV